MSSLADHNGTSFSLFDLQRYRQMRSRNADFARALARTNLAIRCWLGRIGEMPADVEKLRGEHRRVMAWLLANHLVQAYYRRCGIDARPFAIGGMYGYGFAVGPQSPVCQRRDFWETAWVACSSVRVDPLDYDGQPGDAARSYEVAEAIARGEDPLWVIDRASVVALGRRWPPTCPEAQCQHWKDSEIYLTVYQVITLLLAMGYLADAILGTFLDHYYGFNHGATPGHLLRMTTRMVTASGFTPEWFELGPSYHTSRPFGWIHRSRGDLVLRGESRPIPYADWCGGSVDRGLEFLCRQMAV
ncbi:hypothetical protein [Moorella sp. Hama-1]|uniref:hypothetical protein n=1 Tax=Moorella sp. Hama-1 TaxID=2138101 RepID=UPI000D65BA67|nr:hypothetical protein [Moorella sp. Hama-1]